QIGGIIDIIAMLNHHLLSVLPSRGIFLDFFLSSILVGQDQHSIAWGTRYLQGMTAIVLALNRLTAVVYPLRFIQMWSPRNLLVANLMQVVPGVFMALSRANSRSRPMSLEASTVLLAIDY
ncbi:hypothetical protein PENTCL1PPCAC_16466, partial [Pristionchus entomophagus]